MVLRSIEAESLESPTAAGAIAEKMFDLAFIKSGKTLFRASKMFLNLLGNIFYNNASCGGQTKKCKVLSEFVC